MTMPASNGIPGSRDFYQQVLRGLRAKTPPLTLARWCRTHGKTFSTVRSALIGASDSWEARDLRAQLATEAGVE